MDDLWEEYINCTREEIEMLVHQVCFAEIIGYLSDQKSL